MSDSNLQRNRDTLTTAQSQGAVATFLAYFKLSGPGWLQSAITLGGGSLGSALYLGMLGGTDVLWVQLLGVIVGVVMLSAIAYVTLSTGRRPYEAINEYVNPVLGVGWVVAVILANMIWILPQFGLCWDSLATTQLGSFANLAELEESAVFKTKVTISVVIGVAAFIIVLLGLKPGWPSKIFDWVLRILVGFVVICFVAAVVVLASKGEIDWQAIGSGMIPNIEHWTSNSGALKEVGAELSPGVNQFWESKIVANKQNSMVAALATVVGINMTFLLPYSMIARGWDRPFRGLARFDLIMGLAIPFFLVTSCIVIASSHAFHAKADAELLDDDVEVVAKSPIFGSLMKKSRGALVERFGLADEIAARKKYEKLNDKEKLVEAQFYAYELGESAKDLSLDSPEEIREAYHELVRGRAIEAFEKLSEEEQDQKLTAMVAGLSKNEKKLAASIVKPNVKMLAKSLEPALGEKNANLVFGLGAFAMGFSTIIILMIINSYAFAEIAGRFHNLPIRALGALAAGLVGVFWWVIWTNSQSNTWLVLAASVFGAMLLPIAYFSFFALMNNKRLLGVDKPTGIRWLIGNILMIVAVAVATINAFAAISLKMQNEQLRPYIIAILGTFLTMALVGFSARLKKPGGETQTNSTQ